MKSTYKLLGVEWDQLPVSDCMPIIVPKSEIQDYKIDRNIFDLQSFNRQILLTEILSNSNKEFWKKKNEITG